MMDELKKSLVNFGRSCGEFVAALSKAWESINGCAKLSIKIMQCPNGRVKHLALYGRKARTRKKNLKRLLRECEKDG